MINAQDIKIGTAIRMDGKLYFCIDFLHVKPGKGNTFMRTKLKDVVNGYVLERRFNIGEKLEDVRVERRPYQYLYMEGADYIHQYLFRGEVVLGGKFKVVRLVLVLHDLAVMEISVQAGFAVFV